MSDKFEEIRSLVKQSTHKANRISSYMRALRIDNPEVERMLESQRVFNSRINTALRDLQERVAHIPEAKRPVKKQRVLPDASLLTARVAVLERDKALSHTAEGRLKRQVKELQRHIVYRDRIIEDLRDGEQVLLQQLLAATNKLKEVTK